jgi:hypothetical protein
MYMDKDAAEFLVNQYTIYKTMEENALISYDKYNKYESFECHDKYFDFLRSLGDAFDDEKQRLEDILVEYRLDRDYENADRIEEALEEFDRIFLMTISEQNDVVNFHFGSDVYQDLIRDIFKRVSRKYPQFKYSLHF